jgi:hypothetical protein
MSRRARIALAAATVAIVAAGPGPAFASWAAGGSGSAFAKGRSMPAGNRPTVSVTGRNVTVSWTAASFAGGPAVSGYRVTRYSGGTGSTPGASCNGTIAALTCTENGVAPGTYTYTDAPRQGLWNGAESPNSTSVVVGSPSFSLSAPTWITSLPTTLSGSIANYVTGETVTFRLDDASSGTVLSGSTTPSTIPTSGSATTSTTIPAGTGDGTHAVYAVGSGGASTATASIGIDRTAPTISAKVIIKNQGGTSGFVKQGGTYYVYANVSDATSGVSTVRANVSAITTGATNVTLSSGSWTVRGVTYNYRSALQTASNPLAAGSKSFTVTATDVAGNSTTPSGSATVDNTAPTAADIQAANTSGLTVGKAETGDTITWSFSEPIEPESLVAGWDGTAMTVTLRIQNNSGGDRVQVRNAAKTATYPVGTTLLANTGYVTAQVNFTGSTMTMTGTTLVVVLGTPSAPGSVGTVATTGTTTYTPVNSLYDRAANACSTATASESGGLDVEF